MQEHPVAIHRKCRTSDIPVMKLTKSGTTAAQTLVKNLHQIAINRGKNAMAGRGQHHALQCIPCRIFPVFSLLSKNAALAQQPMDTSPGAVERGACCRCKLCGREVACLKRYLAHGLQKQAVSA
ncbi:MAG: hypothetical protein LBU24_02360 [Methanocalculaceae archaeon]|jgi:hypothetical protein|nr:hypothetical protein [Methanocalculaceae archaeon]